MNTEYDRDTIDRAVGRLAKAASRLADPALRRHFVVQRLEPLEDDFVVEVLHGLQVRGLEGDAACADVVMSGLDTELLREQLGALRVARIYHEASRKKYTDVCNLFRALAPRKLPAGEEENFLQYGLATLSAGERRSAARRRDPDILDRAGYDPDPRVIRQMLQNPRTVEKMVVAIAARRPNRPDVLTEIYRSAKWRIRGAVREALVRNPYTPPRLAVSLVAGLQRRELLDVMVDENLHPEVRGAAERALSAKRRAVGRATEPIEDAVEPN